VEKKAVFCETVVVSLIYSSPLKETKYFLELSHVKANRRNFFLLSFCYKSIFLDFRRITYLMSLFSEHLYKVIVAIGQFRYIMKILAWLRGSGG